jgi:hypothetical protein
MPMVSIYPILAQRYRLEVWRPAALLVATLASFVTLNAFLAIAAAGSYYNPVHGRPCRGTIERIAMQEKRLVSTLRRGERVVARAV